LSNPNNPTGDCRVQRFGRSEFEVRPLPADENPVQPLKFTMSDFDNPEIFHTVLDSLQTGVTVVDRNGKIFFWNQGAERITGLMRHEAVGRTCRDNILLHCNGQGCVACGATCPFTRSLHEGKPQEAKMQLRHKAGHPVHVLMRIAPVRDQHGSIIGIAESFDEQKFGSERDHNQHTLAAHGCMDETTGVPNHEFTRFHLSKNLASFATYHLPFGVIAIQVDRLEHLRAAYGRQAGDAVLRVVAQTMRSAFRPSDFLGRWREDQFLAILINCGNAGVEQTWQRIRKMVTCAGLRWWSDELSVTTSVGYGSAQTEDTIESLLERAQSSLERSSPKRAAAAGSQGNQGSSET
jgi:diguanylate cyclase (GGDEF)-like protein/PAS domain S-box-containing protein